MKGGFRNPFVSGGVAALIPYGGIVALFVFLGIIMWLFELEVPHAVVLTIVYFVISFVVAYAVRTAGYPPIPPTAHPSPSGCGCECPERPVSLCRKAPVRR